MTHNIRIIIKKKEKKRRTTISGYENTVKRKNLKTIENYNRNYNYLSNNDNYECWPKFRLEYFFIRSKFVTDPLRNENLLYIK